MISRLALTLALASARAATAQAPLRIWSIDAEGGAATLIVTPQGHSLLIDAGWPKGMGGPRGPGAPPAPGTAPAIEAAAKEAGISRIDDLLVTHYHVDHVGGVPDVAAALPVGTFLDHGPNREEAPPPGSPPGRVASAPATLYPRYLQLTAQAKHRVLAPGDTLRIDGLTLTAVNADRKVLAAPLSGAGEPGVGCAGAAAPAGEGGEENPRSLGVVLGYGRARILALGDTTRDVELQLVCPRDLIGHIDLMFSDHHGLAYSNGPWFVRTLRPRVVVVNNGATKGGDGEVLDLFHDVAGRDAVWQLHGAARTPDKDGPADHIANLTGETDMARPLEIAVRTDGTITVTNPRNGATQTYPAR